MAVRRILNSIFLLAFIAFGKCLPEADYGSFLGKFLTLSNKVKGHVFAIDEHTLFVKGFSYDGLSHDAVFWAGSSEFPDRTGFHIPNDVSQYNPLHAAENQNLFLHLPGKTNVENIRWLAVWDRDQSKSMGSLIFLSPHRPPQLMSIGRLVNTKHGITTGDILIKDSQTIMVLNFKYDGPVKDAYWMLSKGIKPNGDGILLLEHDRAAPLVQRNDNLLTLTLPDGHHVEDYDILSIWSKNENDHYGFVDVPRNLHVPPSLRLLQSQEPKMLFQENFNCEMLNDNLGLEVRWFIDRDDIIIHLVGNIAPSEYMALGLSKDDTYSKFDAADAIITGVDKDGKGFAIDYYFEGDKKCKEDRGMCPDTAYGSQNNLQLLKVEKVHTEGRENFTIIKLKRRLKAEDSVYDQTIHTDGPQAILWAVGPMDSDGMAGSPTLQSRGNLLLDFGREPMWNCPAQIKDKDHHEHTLEHVSHLKEIADKIHCPGDRLFRAQLGQAPHNRSEKVWYINGIPKPELVIQRGTAYLFIIEGGLTPPNHHPFYITNSPKGGLYKNILEANEEIEITYAGIEKDPETSVIFPTAEGRLCFWSYPDEDLEQFGVFRNLEDEPKLPLELKCEPGKPGKLIWTPTAETPNEIYYQSYTERNLGGKIRVVDFCEETKPHRYLEISTTKGGKPNIIIQREGDSRDFESLDREGDSREIEPLDREGGSREHEFIDRGGISREFESLNGEGGSREFESLDREGDSREFESIDREGGSRDFESLEGEGNFKEFETLLKQGNSKELESLTHAEKADFSIDESRKKVEEGSPELMREKYSLKTDKNNINNNIILSSGISSDKLTERHDIIEKQQALANETVTTNLREAEGSDEIFPHDESERSDKYVSNLENSRKLTNQINAVLNSHRNADELTVKYPAHSTSEASSHSEVGKPFSQEFKPQFEGGFIPLVTNPMKEKESAHKKEFVLPPHHQNRPHRPFLYNESVPFHGTFKPGIPDFSGFNISNYSQEDASIIFSPVGQDNLALLSAPKPHTIPRNFPPIGAIPLHLLDRPIDNRHRPQRVQAFGPRFQSLKQQPSLAEMRKNTFPHLPVNSKPIFPIHGVRSEDLTGVPSQRVYVSMQTTGDKKPGLSNIPNLSTSSGYNRNVQNSHQSKNIFPPTIQRRPDFYEEKRTNLRHPNEPQRKFNTPQGFPHINNKHSIQQSGKLPLIQSGVLPLQVNNRPNIPNSNIPLNNFQGSSEKIISPQGPLRLPYPLINMPQRERVPQNPLLQKPFQIRSNPLLFENSNVNGGHFNHPQIPGLMLPLPMHTLNHSEKPAETFNEPQIRDSDSSKEQRLHLENAESAEERNKHNSPTVTRDKPLMNQEMIIQKLPFNETLGAFVLSTNLKSPQSLPGINFQENGPLKNNPDELILNNDSLSTKGNVPSRLNDDESNPLKSEVPIRAIQILGDNREQIVKEKKEQDLKYDEPPNFNSRPTSFLDREINKYAFEASSEDDFSFSKDSKENPVPYFEYEHEDNPDSSASVLTDADYLHSNVPFGARLKFPQNGSRIPVKPINETPKIPTAINRRPQTYSVNNANRNSGGFVKSEVPTISSESTTRPATSVPNTVSTATDATLIAMESAESNLFNEKQMISSEKEEKVKSLYYEPPFSNLHVNYEISNLSNQDTNSSYEMKHIPIIADTLDDIGETGFLGRKNILLNSTSSFPSLIIPPKASEDINLPQISDNPPTHDNRTDYSILNHVLTLIGGPPE